MNPFDRMAEVDDRRRYLQWMSEAVERSDHLHEALDMAAHFAHTAPEKQELAVWLDQVADLNEEAANRIYQVKAEMAGA